MQEEREFCYDCSCWKKPLLQGHRPAGHGAAACGATASAIWATCFGAASLDNRSHSVSLALENRSSFSYMWSEAKRCLVYPVGQVQPLL
ncbi:hypothetical protein BS78_06G177100 [Paspalum vaginatum]|nr:hypothetical protein BS78_06G177100 [Paspalum vaginatum]